MRHWPALAWGSLLAAALLLVLGLAWPIPELAPGPEQEPGGPADLIPLLPGVTAVGRFEVDRPGLMAVSLPVATYQRRNFAHLRLELWRDGRRLAALSRQATWFPDLGRVELRFFWLPQALPAGRFELRAWSPDSSPTDCVALLGREGRLNLTPLYLGETRPLLAWLRRHRPDYFGLSLGLLGLLVAGGLAVGLGSRRPG